MHINKLEKISISFVILAFIIGVIYEATSLKKDVEIVLDKTLKLESEIENLENSNINNNLKIEVEKIKIDINHTQALLSEYHSEINETNNNILESSYKIKVLLIESLKE